MRTCDNARLALADALARFQVAAEELALAIDEAGAWTERDDRPGAEFLDCLDDAVRDYPTLVLHRLTAPRARD